MGNDIHICNGCGKVKQDAGHLCDPVEIKEAYVCDHCGTASKDPRHMPMTY